MAGKPTLTLAAHKRQLKDAGLKFNVLGDWSGSVTPTTYQCRKCQYTWDGVPNYVRRLAGCPKCLKTRRKTTDEYREEIAELNPKVRVLGTYEKCNVKLEHQCVACDHKWMALPINIRRGTNCPKCSSQKKSAFMVNNPIKLNGTKRVRVRVNGKLFYVQGYEPHALRWLVNELGLSVADIRTTKVPTFDYRFDQKDRRYLPDFLVKNDIVVEVKSLFTAGLTTDTNHYYPDPDIRWRQLVAKAKAVEKAGYRFRLLVMNRNGNRINLPVDWQRKSHKSMLKVLAAV